MKTKITSKISKGIIYALLTFNFITLQTFNLFSQGGAAVNTTGAASAPSAMLDVSSSNQGLLIPRVFLTSTTSASPINNPANKLIVYNTNASMSEGNGAGIYIYDSTNATTGKWINLAAPSNGPGTNGQVLTSEGQGIASTWTTPTSGTVTNVATGTGLTGGPITSTGTISLANGANSGQVYVTGATPFTPALVTMSSDATISSAGALTIANNAVTYAKMQAVGTTSKLLGSSSTTTPVQEITLGSGLSLSGTTLTASSSTPTYTVGTAYAALGGGYVFQVNSANPNTIGSTGTHGLVAAPSDQSTSNDWYTAKDAISTYVTANASAMVFSDWRLPTKSELNLMYSVLYLYSPSLGGFAATNYWNSNDAHSTGAPRACGLDFSTNTQTVNYKNVTAYVRAVRSF